MIAVISSTIAPSRLPSHDGERTSLSPETRLAQTRATIASVQQLGISDIVLADNSPGDWVRERASALSPARCLHFEQPPVKGKGIGESWLLIAALAAIPDGEAILKISGRYRLGPGTELALEGDEDVVAKVSGSGPSAELSTRCYLLRNKQVASRLWPRAMDEIYAEPSRIVGPRSLARIVRNSLRPRDDTFPYADPNTLSLEQATLRAIHSLGLRLRRVGTLDLTGNLGGTNEVIKE